MSEKDADEIITCWCGAKVTYEELFAHEYESDEGCGGTGMIQCLCGGDQCVCHHHGEYDCPGCDECESDDDWDDDYDEEDSQ